MIKQNIVFEGTRLDVQRRYVQMLEGFVKGIRVYSETSSSMLCIPQQVNVINKNVRFTPKLSVMSIR
jgi:hypothetical protein